MLSSFTGSSVDNEPPVWGKDKRRRPRDTWVGISHNLRRDAADAANEVTTMPTGEPHAH